MAPGTPPLRWRARNMEATCSIGGLATGAGRRRVEQTDTDLHERADEPKEGPVDAVLFVVRHRVPAGVRLLHRVFGHVDRTEQVICEVLEEASFGDDDAERAG
ncbi:hypothetical protein OG990_20325 [Micromonospora sp. NBC_00858]|nr:hypothetical protein OG990_20325 [Micromonospora sp. NBC_00858]